MTIACLGWGSLIWNVDNLPIRGDWQADGPSLPIEYVRKSNDGRITLVIAEAAEPVVVLWAALESPSVEHARLALAEREGVSPKNAQKRIGGWSPGSRESFTGSPAIAEWAESKQLSGVVWTALGSKFPGVDGAPTCDQVLDYLSNLDAKTEKLAEEYIRRTPAQIRTAYRIRIEEELGWTPIG